MPTRSRMTILLATDHQRSVINALDANRPQPIAYTPFGHRAAKSGLLSLLGFNGEQADTLTGHYHLGNGYRQFNPVLMRFNTPDSWSPFGEGGLNAYAYCGADPINRSDRTGHSFWQLIAFARPTSTPARIPTYSQKTLNTAKKIANMEQGMIYKGQTLGYQYGEKLDLNKKSIHKINKYTDIIKKNNGELTERTQQLLETMPESDAKLEAVRGFRERSIYFPTVNPSTPKDHAVRELHSQAMHFKEQVGYINHLLEIKKNTTPAIITHIRELT